MPRRDWPPASSEKQPLRKTPKHIADEPVGEIEPEDPTIQNPTTDRGLVVEEQVHKEWDPKKQGGLPTFLQQPRRGAR